MRKIFALILLIAILALSFSCKNEATTTTLRVELNKGTRTIAPNDSSMEITGYRIIPTGPDGKAISTRYTYYSYCNLENIEFGKWTIEVYGFNSNRVDIAYGREEIVVSSTNNTIRVNVDKLIGKGSLSLTMTWNKDEITSPSLKLYLKSQDSTESERELLPSVTASEGRAQVEATGLAAGSYTLRGELYDNGVKISGFMEAIRISNEKTTKGTIPFEITKLDESSGSSTIDISNTTSSPIEVAISGVEKLVSKNTKFTVTLSILTNKVQSSQVKAIWYLDGERIGTGLSCVVDSANIGNHRIDVVVSTSNNGSTGSSYATFSTVATTKRGTPYSMKLLKSSDINLGSNILIRFIPNGRLLVASNEMKTLQILSLDSGSPERIKSYTYAELSINGNIADIASAMLPADTSSTVYVVTNDDPEIVALSYTKNGDALSYKSKQVNIKDNKGTKIDTLGPAIALSNGGFLKKVIVAAATLNHKDVGILFLDGNPTSSTNFIEMNRLSNYIYGEGKIDHLDFSESSDAVTAISGSTGIVYQLKQASSGTIAQNPTALSDSLEKIRNQDYESFTRGIMGRILSPTTGFGYVLTSNALNLYAANWTSTMFICEQTNKSYRFTAHLDKIPALAGTYDNLFYYMIDNLCKKLYILTFEDGNFICDKDNDFVTLPSTEYNKIELSRDGRYMVLYNPSCPTKDIALLTIAR